MNPLDVINNDAPMFIRHGNAINMRLLSEKYGFKQAEMTRLLDRKKQQVSKFFNKEDYSPKAADIREKLEQLIKIYKLLRVLLKQPNTVVDAAELDKKIVLWFRILNPAYPGAKSPFQLVAEGKGDVVIRSLTDQLHGIVS